ncbi:TPA: hypothetical protein I7235_19115 [Vibrio vulnificus]|nr:hypothetical protein [Vibrio vulnificus]HDY7594024.1 hypothetical protein [Vibrio vulnificus]
MKVLKMYQTEKRRNEVRRESESIYEFFCQEFNEFFDNSPDSGNNNLSKQLIRLYVNDVISKERYKEIDDLWFKALRIIDDMSHQLCGAKLRKGVISEEEIARFTQWHNDFKILHRRAADLMSIILNFNNDVEKYNESVGALKDCSDIELTSSLMTIEKIAFLIEVGYTKASIKNVFGITDSEMRKVNKLLKERAKEKEVKTSDCVIVEEQGLDLKK